MTRFSGWFITVIVALVPFIALGEDPIRLGAVFSLSGWGAEGGTAELNGALLAQDDINAAGGIGGRSVKLLVEDNQSDLKSTASAIRKLINLDKVPAIVGPNWAEFTEIMVPIAESSQIPFVSPSGYKEGLFRGKQFAFTLWPPHTVATRPLVELFKARGFHTIYVLLTENAYLEGIFEAIRQQLKDSDIKIESVARFNQGQSDYRSIIGRVKQANPDAVLALLVENGDLSVFFTQAKQLNLSLPLFTANGIPFDEIIKKNPSIAESVIYFDFFVSGGESFSRRYRERFHREAGFSSAKAYDAVFLLVNAARDCGLKPAQIRSCLAKVDYRGESGDIAFNSDGIIKTNEANTYLLHVRDGKFEKLTNGG